MTKKLKPIPDFRSEAEEREFWESHDSTDYVDWSKAQRARFPNLKLSIPVSASAKPPRKTGHDSD
jgi:CopG antitoxin of type II toxin-antitoxin system